MVNPQTQQGVNPRTTRVRQVILDAAGDLLVEHGAGEVTASRIAQETGVARTTIYRHWPDQSHLLLDTIDSLVAPHSPTTFTDDLEADLMTALSNLRARMTRQPFRQVFAAYRGSVGAGRDSGGGDSSRSGARSRAGRLQRSRGAQGWPRRRIPGLGS